MSQNAKNLIDINLKQMDSDINSALSILGEGWFERLLTEDKKARAVAKRKNQYRQRILYEPKHPLVQWYLEYETSRSSIPVGGYIQNQSALLLQNFVMNLIAVKNSRGIEHILPRLRLPTEFKDASFELEVASSYVARNWEIEFIEASKKSRSPDLKVTDDQSRIFWVECKCRDQRTGRDEKVWKFWESLQQNLYRKWMPSKHNFSLLLTSEDDPDFSELDELSNDILEAGRMLIKKPDRKQTRIVCTKKDKKYEFKLAYLADPDEHVPLPNQVKGYDWHSISCEHMTGSEAIYRNPKYFGFVNKNPSDQYAGIINSFKSAVGQLPETGPGVVWIRIPCPFDLQNAKEQLDAILRRLEGELSGSHNTRVNCVILSVRFFEYMLTNSQKALTYRHIFSSIEHKNPRS